MKRVKKKGREEEKEVKNQTMIITTNIKQPKKKDICVSVIKSKVKIKVNKK